VSNCDSFARQYVAGLAEEHGWPEVATRHGMIGPGEGAWREFLDGGATIFALGSAERGLEALAQTTTRGEASAPRGEVAPGHAIALV